MPRALTMAVSITAGVSIFLLAVRTWTKRNSLVIFTGNIKSKYNAMLIKEKKHISEDREEESAQIMIFYGSSSGNAESYAKSFVANLKERGADVILIDPSSWSYLTQYDSHRPLFPSIEKEKNPIVIFIIATTGEGEVPSNFFSLFSEMQTIIRGVNNNEEKPFNRLNYAVFALGDSSYKYFCRAGIDVNKLLNKGGGTELLPMVLSDARNALQDDAFEKWEEEIMEVLEHRCEVKLNAESDTPPNPQLVLRFRSDCQPSPLAYTPPPSMLEPSMQFPGQFIVISKISRTPCRDSDNGSFIIHLVLSTEKHMVSYQAGDHLGIYPANPPHLVEEYRKTLNISFKDWMTPVELCTAIKARARASLRNTLPARVNLCTVFERYLDLSGKPRKSMLRVLVKYCSDPKEKLMFKEILRQSSKNNNKIEKELENNSSNQFRTILDYLKKFPSCCCIPIEHFLEMIPRIQPRFYSIASDMMTHPETVETFIRIIPDGLNSQYLKNINIGENITAFIRKSVFHLPMKSNERPVIMIGPGTGVASMIGFCYRREYLKKKYPNTKYGPMILFFGAQKRKTEYFVQRELESWCHHGEGKIPSDEEAKNSVITLLDLAFSRDQSEKYYVTNLIEKHKDYLLQLLHKTENGGCLIYLSGEASQMAKSVEEALLNILQYGGMTRSAASEYLRKMERERRFLRDVY